MRVKQPRSGGAMWAGRFAGLLVAASVLWAAAFPCCVRRDVSLTIPAVWAGEACALEWRRAGDDAFNGVWLAPEVAEGADLIITRRLPAYAIDELRLVGLRGVPLAEEGRVTLTVSALGRELDRREGFLSVPVTLEGPGQAEAGVVAPPAGSLVTVEVETGWPAWLHLAGFAGAAMVVVLGYSGVRWVWKGLEWAGRGAAPLLRAVVRLEGDSGRAPRSAKVVVGAVVVAVHVWAGVSAPLILTGDAVDYLIGAEALARTGSLAALPTFKAPLFPAILSIPFATGLDALSFAHVVLVACGLLTPWLVYLPVRTAASERAGLAAALTCGLNPVLITLEAYLLRETFAAAVVAGASLALVKFAAGGGRSRLWAAASLGGIAGAGALLRENFQTLLVILPAVVVLLPVAGSTWRSRIAAGAVCLAVALVCVGPWYAHHAQRFGRIGMTLPKTNKNKALNAWFNGTLDLNQTRTTSYRTWRDLEERQRRRRLSDYEAVNSVIVAPRRDAPAMVRDRPSEGPTALSAYVERVTGVMVNESVARAPERQWGARLRAATSLTGLWSPPKHPSATSMTWFSGPMRGVARGDDTSVRIGPLSGEYARAWARLTPMLEKHETPLPEGVSPAFSRWSDRLWRGNQALKPVIGALMVIGCIVAWRRRAWSIVAIGFVIGLNLLGAAWVVVTPVDRVAAPFIPGMVVIAVWVVWEWVGSGGPERTGRTVDCSHADGQRDRGSGSLVGGKAG